MRWLILFIPVFLFGCDQSQSRILIVKYVNHAPVRSATVSMIPSSTTSDKPPGSSVDIEDWIESKKIFTVITDDDGIAQFGDGDWSEFGEWVSLKVTKEGVVLFDHFVDTSADSRINIVVGTEEARTGQPSPRPEKGSGTNAINLSRMSRDSKGFA